MSADGHSLSLYALDSRLRGNYTRGVQRGEAPLRFIYTPKNGGQWIDKTESRVSWIQVKS